MRFISHRFCFIIGPLLSSCFDLRYRFLQRADTDRVFQPSYGNLILRGRRLARHDLLLPQAKRESPSIESFYYSLIHPFITYTTTVYLRRNETKSKISIHWRNFLLIIVDVERRNNYPYTANFIESSNFFLFGSNNNNNKLDDCRDSIEQWRDQYLKLVNRFGILFFVSCPRYFDNLSHSRYFQPFCLLRIWTWTNYCGNHRSNGWLAYSRWVHRTIPAQKRSWLPSVEREREYLGVLATAGARDTKVVVYTTFSPWLVSSDNARALISDRRRRREEGINGRDWDSLASYRRWINWSIHCCIGRLFLHVIPFSVRFEDVIVRARFEDTSRCYCDRDNFYDR